MSKRLCWADGYEVGSVPCRDWHENYRQDAEDPAPGTVVIAQMIGDFGEVMERPFMRIYAVGGYDGWVGMDGERINCDTFSHRAGFVVLEPVHTTTWKVTR